MEYIKIRFTNDFDELGAKFEKSIGEMFQAINPVFTLSERTWKPPMDIYETPEEILVLAEIAGVNREDLELEISNRAVRIFGKRTNPPSYEDATFRLAEIQYGKFERTLFLPSHIDPEVVSASYRNGFLQIRLAKQKPAEPRRIPVSSE